MAERPSELNEKTLASVDENNNTALTVEKTKDSYLKDSSDEIYSDRRCQLNRAVFRDARGELRSGHSAQ